jgi:hypothetical protein
LPVGLDRCARRRTRAAAVRPVRVRSSCAAAAAAAVSSGRPACILLLLPLR